MEVPRLISEQGGRRKFAETGDDAAMQRPDHRIANVMFGKAKLEDDAISVNPWLDIQEPGER